VIIVLNIPKINIIMDSIIVQQIKI